MRYAVGLMVCIAIAFLVITSPDKQPKASTAQVNQAIQARHLDALHDSLNHLSRQLAQLKDDAADDTSEQEIADLRTVIDRHEAKLVSITGEIEKAASAPEASVCDCEDLERRVQDLERKVASLQAPTVSSGYGSTGSVLKSGGSTGSIVQSVVPVPTVTTTTSTYTPRWNNYDGLTLRDHAINVHGFDASLPTAQLARLHDSYHDAYGGQAPMRSRAVTVATSTSDCPDGICPVNRTRIVTSTSRGGLLGFGILRRR